MVASMVPGLWALFRYSPMPQTAITSSASTIPVTIILFSFIVGPPFWRGGPVGPPLHSVSLL
jgi:hypothetical protein